MGEASDLAESMFAAYLDSHGYSHAFEPDLGVTRRPDFVIARDGIEVICEVKAFEGWGMFEPGGPRVGHRSMKEALSPVREAIRSASKQLKDVRDRGTPLVVVIANPLGRPLATGTAEVMWAMYGDPEMQASLGPMGTTSDWQTVVGRNGKLRNDHSYISAVATLNRRWHEQDFMDLWWDENVPDDARSTENVAELLAASRLALDAADVPDDWYVWMEVVETLSTKAVALPRNVFDGARDRRFAATDDRSGITEVVVPARHRRARGPRSTTTVPDAVLQRHGFENTAGCRAFGGMMQR